MPATDIKERLRMCSPYSDDGTMNNRTANALLTEAASEIARLEQALAAANGEAESTRYLLAEEKRRAADLERKLRVAEQDLDACMEGLETLKQVASMGPAIHSNLCEAGRNEVAIRAEYAEMVQKSTQAWKDGDAATDAAGLEVR